jgi:hypothetical protein
VEIIPVPPVKVNPKDQVAKRAQESKEKAILISQLTTFMKRAEQLTHMTASIGDECASCTLLPPEVCDYVIAPYLADISVEHVINLANTVSSDETCVGRVLLAFEREPTSKEHVQQTIEAWTQMLNLFTDNGCRKMNMMCKFFYGQYIDQLLLDFSFRSDEDNDDDKVEDDVIQARRKAGRERYKLLEACRKICMLLCWGDGSGDVHLIVHDLHDLDGLLEYYQCNPEYASRWRKISQRMMAYIRLFKL